MTDKSDAVVAILATSPQTRKSLRYGLPPLPSYSVAGASLIGEPESEGEDEDPRRRRRRLRVLLVDDDDVDRERVYRMVDKASLPYDVVGVASGVDALHRLAEEEFQLLLLDYQLGDMTGLDLLSVLKQRTDFCLPVIMITGGGDEELAVKVLRQGVADYVPKRSLNVETLRIALQGALRMAETEARLRITQERLLRLSVYDELTGLPNRSLFFDRLDQLIVRCEREDETFTLLMIDLDLFKEVNDHFGHATGDRVLAAIGDRLLRIARKSDTVARLGGDEFACLLPGTHLTQDVDAFVEKLHEAICRLVEIDDRVVQIGASIGVARFPEDGDDGGTLLANADAAMYAAKNSHRKYVFFDSPAAKLKNVTPGCQNLREAIAQGELYLEYQPQVALASDEVVGLEALVRWHSPKYGLVTPNDFIPSAERSGLIKELTRTVMVRGFEQIVEWREAGIYHPVSFNISARLLDDKAFLNWLNEQMLKSHIDPGNIVLEITETALTSNFKKRQQTLVELSQQGIALSIDDFGAGFTSLRSIREWIPTEVKIDSLFVKDIHDGSRDASIVRSIIMLAESLGIRVVAEGIETRGEWDFLVSIGCECGQGYGIAKPMSAETIIHWLLRRQAGDTSLH